MIEDCQVKDTKEQQKIFMTIKKLKMRAVLETVAYTDSLQFKEINRKLLIQRKKNP